MAHARRHVAVAPWMSFRLSAHSRPRPRPHPPPSLPTPAHDPHDPHARARRARSLARSLVQDIVCRYAHQTGHYVERRFGWDCHGLPVEFEIDKKLGSTPLRDRNPPRASTTSSLLLLLLLLLSLPAHRQDDAPHTRARNDPTA